MKDLSRLGRNQFHTGLYIEERFRGPFFAPRQSAGNGLEPEHSMAAGDENDSKKLVVCAGSGSTMVLHRPLHQPY